MAVYGKFKESGLYIKNEGIFVTSTADIKDATDISEIMDILEESGMFEFVTV